MKRNHYFENYINNLQKEIFLIAFDYGYDIIDFISCYMKSYVRKEMDKPYSSWHNQSSNRIVEEVLFSNNIKKNKSQTINRDAVEWLGFFYSKWHFITGESSKTILRFLSPEEGIKNYYTLHQLDEREAIEMCIRRYNLSRNNHRSNECKNGYILEHDQYSIIYYSFLAVRILYKLTKEKIYNELEYIGDNKEYDFADKEYHVGIKSNVIFKSDTETIVDKYVQAEYSANNYLRKTDKSIYFCFIFKENLEINIDIPELKNKHASSGRHFDYLYLYINGKIYEITPTNELSIYSVPFSKRENAGIINKMKTYGLPYKDEI